RRVRRLDRFLLFLLLLFDGARRVVVVLRLRSVAAILVPLLLREAAQGHLALADGALEWRQVELQQRDEQHQQQEDAVTCQREERREEGPFQACPPAARTLARNQNHVGNTNGWGPPRHPSGQ